MLCKKSNNAIEGVPSFYKKVRLYFSGKNNKVIFGKNCNLLNCKIKIYGNSSLILGDDVYLENCTIILRESTAQLGSNCEGYNMTITAAGNSSLELGSGSVLCGDFDLRNKGIIRAKKLWTTWGPLIAANDGLIEIGHSCITDAVIYNSDYHPIYDCDGNHLNANKDVIIGDNVWVGRKAFILKGARLGEGCIVAAGTYTGKEVPAYAVIAGNPGRIVREKAFWSVDKIDEAEGLFPLRDENSIKNFYDKAFGGNPTIRYKKNCRFLTKIRLLLSLCRAK